MGELSIDYWLPVSVVRLTGQKYEIEDLTKPRGQQKRTESVLTAQLQTQPDVEAQRSLLLKDGDLTETAAAVTFSADGRLLSIDASTEGQGPALVKAGVTLGGTILGTVLAFQNPLLGVPALAAIGRVQPTNRFKAGPEGEDATKPSALLPGYTKAHPNEARVLDTYLRALATLMESHAIAAEEGDLARVRDLTRLLRLTRTEASLLQDHYQSWLAKQVVRTRTETVEEDFVIDNLPTERVLRERLDTRSVREIHAYSQDEARRELVDSETEKVPWAVFGRDHGIAVSVDYLDAPAPVADTSHDSDALMLAFRKGRTARIRTWVVERVPTNETRDGGGNDVTIPAHYKVRLAKTEHRTVIPRRVNGRPNEITFALPRGAFQKGTLAVTFDESGNLVKLGTKRSSAARNVATTAAELPTTFESGLDTGSKIAAGLLPGSAEAADLERKLKIAKTQKELNGFADTDQPDPAATALKKLQAQVREAELKARLTQAQALENQVASGLTVVHIGEGDGQ